MVMSDMKVLYGVTEVYDSTEAKCFAESEQYPIAWEIMFVNNAAGMEFAQNATAALSKLPKNKVQLMGFSGSHSDAARCLECAFKDGNALRQFLNESLANMTIYNDQQNRVIPKQELCDKAKEIAAQAGTAVGLSM